VGASYVNSGSLSKLDFLKSTFIKIDGEFPAGVASIAIYCVLGGFSNFVLGFEVLWKIRDELKTRPS